MRHRPGTRTMTRHVYMSRCINKFVTHRFLEHTCRVMVRDIPICISQNTHTQCHKPWHDTCVSEIYESQTYLYIVTCTRVVSWFVCLVCVSYMSIYMSSWLIYISSTSTCHDVHNEFVTHIYRKHISVSWCVCVFRDMHIPIHICSWPIHESVSYISLYTWVRGPNTSFT